ncbi:MAG: S-methyl-5'-thioinosine phosphorylase [Gammaproteobacteria bacterium]|nr:MAG: S-methyl-5'-thioinosine phosphorylase [Gammaproteobacteria bacterium]
MIGIIGGTGLLALAALDNASVHTMETPWGAASSGITVGEWQGTKVAFLPRHGNPHVIPPHAINYRANIWALKKLGVEKVIAVAAVGGITPRMAPRRIAICDQLIDYTYDRKHTFFEDDLTHVTHVDFTYPYSDELRNILIQAAKAANIEVCTTATYGCTQGPRLETVAEVLKLERDGCDVVGMTGMPEAALARELEMEYANCAVVANWAAGKTEGLITMAEIEEHLTHGMADVKAIIEQALKII